MEILKNSNFKFDRFLPIYNWYYPLGNQKPKNLEYKSDLNVFKNIISEGIHSRAFYFHFPFCETLCSFCPFVKTLYSDEDLIKIYTDCIIKEINIKSSFRNINSVPVGSIFFGGGTPSLLSTNLIKKIGKTIREGFDLSSLTEFSFEAEVKSITEEKLAALKEIGVTHLRFGLQTFNKKYRDLFDLTATLEKIYFTLELLPKYFDNYSFDILYGMNGQSSEEFISDIDLAVATGAPNIDFYPINNLMIQPKLNNKYRELKLKPTSALNKYFMNIMLREYMISKGYYPHNGHGYVKIKNPETADTVVTNHYSFKYHEYVYGYSNRELIGFGTNAISSFNKYSLFNISSRNKYMNNLLNKNLLDFQIGEHSDFIDHTRPVALRLPYHGELNKKYVNWNMVDKGTLDNLQLCIEHGLIKDSADKLELSLIGWFWYVNLMYFLSPYTEKNELDKFIKLRQNEKSRILENLTIIDYI